jgi:hypothetical protein
MLETAVRRAVWAVLRPGSAERRRPAPEARLAERQETWGRTEAPRVVASAVRALAARARPEEVRRAVRPETRQLLGTALARKPAAVATTPADAAVERRAALRPVRCSECSRSPRSASRDCAVARVGSSYCAMHSRCMVAQMAPALASEPAAVGMRPSEERYSPAAPERVGLRSTQ